MKKIEYEGLIFIVIVSGLTLWTVLKVGIPELAKWAALFLCFALSLWVVKRYFKETL